MNRRQFAYVTTFAGAVAATGRAERNAAPIGRIPEAAGVITEMVFIDDCVRVAMYDHELSEAARKALTAYPDFVRNGALWPSQQKGGPKAGNDAKAIERFALSGGRLCSEALNRHRRPNSAEARLYQDVAVMHDMAVMAGCAPDKPAPIADLLDVMHVRRRLGMHTLNPDDNIQPWLEGIVTWWNDARDLRAALAAAYAAPDSGKMREFTAGFYNPAAPLIRLARAFQIGEVAPADAFSPALDHARKANGYARALAEAVESLRKMPTPA